MALSEDTARFASDLQKRAPEVRTNVQAFPSGAVWLDVHYAGRLFTLAYLPTGQIFGVDEFDLEEHGIGTSFRFSFGDLQSAEAKLLNLLQEAGAIPV
jgi:hypothetical protein